MDNRKDITVTLAKYSAYTGIILAIFFERKDNFIPSILLCSFLITIGSVRQFVLEGKLEPFKKYTFALDLALVTLLGLTGYNSIFALGYYIIIVESAMLCPYILAGSTALAACMCFFGVYFYQNDTRLILTKDIGLYILYNSMAFLFFYIISTAGRKQLEQKEKLLATIDKLEGSKQDLEDAYESLIQGNKRLQEVVILEERNRMAREIHDTLAHTLTTIIVEIEAGMKLLAKSGCDSNPAVQAVRDELLKAQNQARVGLDEVRYSIKNLRSGVLNKEGFDGALAMTLEQLKAHRDVDIILDIDDSLDLKDEYEMALFRIIQEAATNSFRHGKSSKLFISLKQQEETLALDIQDNGTGCSDIKAGYGIMGIRERVKKLGGSVEIESSEGNGFRLCVILPYQLEESVTNSILEEISGGQDKDHDR